MLGHLHATLLDDSRVKAALDETAPSNDVQQPPSKKQVLDAANKQSHVLQDAASPPVQKFARKHFDPTDNALKDSVVLEHPLSGEKAPRPEKPIPTIAPSTTAPSPIVAPRHTCARVTRARATRPGSIRLVQDKAFIKTMIINEQELADYTPSARRALVGGSG